MLVGQAIAPHLPFLRRYARALAGNDERANPFVIATLEAITRAPEIIRRYSDPKLGLYRTFHEIWSANAGLLDSEFQPTDASTLGNPATDIARARLARISDRARMALLLTAMESFSAADAGHVIGISETEIETLVTEAVAEIDRQIQTDVLIIEDEPIILLDLETIVRELGHNVVGVATTSVEAVSQALTKRPGLILADIQLADKGSGIDAVKEILAEYPVPVIFVTAYPERLLSEQPEPAFVITKPFQRSTVKATIAQALFSNPNTVPDGELLKAELPTPSGEPSPTVSISRELVAPRPGPVSVKVKAHRLQLVDDTPLATVLTGQDIDNVRRMHLRTARRLAVSLSGSNVGPGFNVRFEEIKVALTGRFSEERGLTLAIQVRGLEQMLPAICERLDDVTAADVTAFITDLVDLLRQVPSYRRFVEEARATEPAQEDAIQAARELMDILAEQPDALVEPALKAAMLRVGDAVDQSDGMGALALLRTVGNAFRAIGRFFNQRITNVGRKATETFDETTGKLVGKAFAYLITGGAVGAALGLLAQAYPAEFGFVSQLVRAARAMLGM